MSGRLLDQEPDDDHPEKWKPLLPEKQTPPEPPPAFTPEELRNTTKSPPLHKPKAIGNYWWQKD